MTAYYNEFDPFAAEWLRNLIKAGLIAPGDVDERNILDVKPGELKRYTQCHFFAGIGVWSYSLRQAGWADNKPVWTASCPCQPFSSSGKHKGFDDERHLWPAFFHLVEECQPVEIFGEQVASKDGYTWLDLVQADLEGRGYTCGTIVASASGFGAPHWRHRTYWVAYSNDAGSQGWEFGGDGSYERTIGESGMASGMADTCCERFDGQHAQLWERQGGNTKVTGDGATRGSWSAADWIYCQDGKHRPVEPGTFPLVDGSPARVGRLRGYGNAIVAPQAEEFIRAYREVME